MILETTSPANAFWKIVQFILLEAAAILGLMWASKHKGKAQIAFNARHSEMSGSYQKEIERLEEQIAKQRRVVQL